MRCQARSSPESRSSVGCQNAARPAQGCAIMAYTQCLVAKVPINGCVTPMSRTATAAATMLLIHHREPRDIPSGAAAWPHRLAASLGRSGKLRLQRPQANPNASVEKDAGYVDFFR